MHPRHLELAVDLQNMLGGSSPLVPPPPNATPTSQDDASDTRERFVISPTATPAADLAAERAAKAPPPIAPGHGAAKVSPPINSPGDGAAVASLPPNADGAPPPPKGGTGLSSMPPPTPPTAGDGLAMKATPTDPAFEPSIPAKALPSNATPTNAPRSHQH